ncbi:sugar transferase [Agromyces bauzanensis]
MPTRIWQRRYIHRLTIIDFVAVSSAVLASQIAWIDTSVSELHIPRSGTRDFTVGYGLISVTIIVLWMTALAAEASRDRRIIGSGNVEYRRVAFATVRVFGLIAIVMFLLKSELGRGYFLTALPLGLVALLIGRFAMRTRLSSRRARGEFRTRVVLVGDPVKTEHLAEGLRRDPSSGFEVVGAVTPGSASAAKVGGGVAVIGEVDQLLDVVQQQRVDKVIFTGSDAVGPREMRELGWKLDELDVRLAVSAALTDVAGPRIHAVPVAGQPIIMVDYPRLDGIRALTKRSFDIVGAAALIALTAPLMVAVAIAVKMTSVGPVLYRQERIGHNGQPFDMLKFRSMVVDADNQLATLLRQQGSDDRPLFKVIDDPRITPIGRFIRKYSLDELPQFFNVLRGEMSLVGPRPQRAAEVDLYDDWAHRRLLVTPGITGLWQVSGRSDLSWEDSMRLDLYYVENWSLFGDLVILWRTVRAVVAPAGAY